MAQKIDHKFDEKYLEHRYCDLKAIIVACVGDISPDELDENYAYVQMECEFNDLAAMLGFEDTGELFERLCKNAEDSEADADV